VSNASLAGAVAVITGASRGIGLSIASTFAGEGAQCVLVVRDRSAGEAAADKIGKIGARPHVLVADVSDRGEIAAIALDVGQLFSRIDIIVNNAGILLDEDRATPVSTMDIAVFRRTLDTNVVGALNVSQVLLPSMARGGRIINVSSTMGQLTGGSAGYAPAYCISKTALNALTQALAADAAARGIMVDCFHPGWAKTAMGGAGATVDPADSAKVALFLATRPQSDETGLFWDHSGVIDW